MYSKGTVVDDILLNSRLNLGEAFMKKGTAIKLTNNGGGY
ncbi:protein of unknown function [Mesotoga infera]|uniref:Uncharacterized protein n=1 Tax=Mesotoga infera TaxID=1236046 RepID=A0A7Z7LHA7_9BACT|nr:protein of unknown function [Mesotoga infera]